MSGKEKVNILLVDDQPGKLLTYEVILAELGENLIKADSARAALDQLLRNDIAIVLVDVCMPELDGFELVSMIRDHPRYQDTAIIFISAIHMTDLDRLRGYQAGAVDYIPVPVVPDILRAKVKVFAELHRKTRELARLTGELERRVAERTAELEASTARLQESESRLRLAQEAGGVVTSDWNIADGTFALSQGLSQLLGLEAGESVLSLARLMNAVHPDDRPRLQAELDEVARHGHHFESEFRIVRPDGSVRWIVQRGEVVRDENGRAVRMRGAGFDVTERRAASDQLARLNAELERRVEERTSQVVQLQKTEALGQITGGVAHDFNNLLAVIGANLGLLKRRLPDDPKLHTLLNGALQGAERGAALTRRMLAFARKQNLKPEAVDIPKLVQGMGDLLQRSLGPRIQIETRFARQLAPAYADPHQLELAILNLAVNSRDAMPDGGPLVIAASEEILGPDHDTGLPPGDYVRLAVIDTGLGMDPSTLDRAAEPFFTTKGVGKGTGLGLAMVQGLVGQSGGAMRIQSRPGSGTEVDLWLPRAEPATHLAPEQSPQSSAIEGSGTCCRVLLVDDDAPLRTAIAAGLEESGHTVIEAASGLQALNLLASDPDIDVLVTDHLMPGMTGAQLIEEVRRMRPKLPAILATGYAELPAGADPKLRLQKPFTLEDLLSMMRKVQGAVPKRRTVNRC